jgi:hypothetical protein
MFAFGLAVRDERFWDGRGDCRQIDRQGGASERRDRQESSDARRKPTLQLVASMRPRTQRHLSLLPRAADATPSRRQSAAA